MSKVNSEAKHPHAKKPCGKINRENEKMNNPTIKLTLAKTEEKNLEERLIKAYFRKFGKDADYPSQTIDYFSHDSINYAVLSNSNYNLAVYKLFENGNFRYCNYLPRHIAWELGFNVP
jgi:hypothetical protein